MLTESRLLELAATAALENWRYWKAECINYPEDENAQRSRDKAKQEYEEIRETLLRGGYYHFRI